jgi:hypothetical protein
MVGVPPFGFAGTPATGTEEERWETYHSPGVRSNWSLQSPSGTSAWLLSKLSVVSLFGGSRSLRSPARTSTILDPGVS